MGKDDIRKASVAGMFYSEEPKELKKTVQSLINQVPSPLLEDEFVRAIIVPHAGYVYSGEVAAYAYAQLHQKKFERIILIGPSHHKRFNGVSVCLQNYYETPLGKVKVDVELAKRILSGSEYVLNVPEAHSQEHSLEVQLPFLQECLQNKFSILPILVGTNDVAQIKEIAAILKPLFSEDNLFVVSTDFSHYPNYEDAVIEDRQTATVLVKNDPELLLEYLDKQKERDVDGLVTGLCGWSAVVLFQYILIGNKPVEYRPLMYQNSGDKLFKNHQRVVGYHSFVVVSKKEQEITDQEREYLLDIAKQSIYQHFNANYMFSNYSHKWLEQYSGAFVSVYVKEKLRGCIGTFHPNRRLKDLVRKLAVDAAFYDSRFDSITKEELNDVSLEISVLGPLKQIHSIEEIRIGKHGIYVQNGMKKGTFLPSVAVRNAWGVTEFIENCARNKAGMTEDEMKNAEMFVYDTLVITDTDG